MFGNIFRSVFFFGNIFRCAFPFGNTFRCAFPFGNLFGRICGERGLFPSRGIALFPLRGIGCRGECGEEGGSAEALYDALGDAVCQSVDDERQLVVGGARLPRIKFQFLQHISSGAPDVCGKSFVQFFQRGGKAGALFGRLLRVLPLQLCRQRGAALLLLPEKFQHVAAAEAVVVVRLRLAPAAAQRGDLVHVGKDGAQLFDAAVRLREKFLDLFLPPDILHVPVPPFLTVLRLRVQAVLLLFYYILHKK